MALMSLSHFSSCSHPLPKQASLLIAHSPALRASGYKCKATASAVGTTERRSADWKPSIWQDDFLKTLNNDHKGEVYVSRAEVLKDEITHVLNQMHEEKGPLALLELIDDIQRLGLGHIYEKDIKRVMGFLKEKNVQVEENLHFTALFFRLFRQHGSDISQDIFNVFMDEQGNFKEHLKRNIKGLLSLYEVSFLAIEGENILEDAKAYSRMHLKDYKGNTDSNLAELVTDALDLPLHYDVTRWKTRWYIDAYSRRMDRDSTLLELAMLDYNIVQAAHQVDLIDTSRWWKKLDLPKKLPYARDRLVECFLCSAGMASEPQHNFLRQVVTKITTLTTLIDDVFDIYATLDELKLFTDSVERWDVNAVEQLPDHMKFSFLALFNTINEIGYDILAEKGFNIIPYLRVSWLDLFKAYLLEATWYHTGYKPTLKEYLDNASVSIGGPLVCFHTYVVLCPKLTKESVEDYLENCPNFIGSVNMIARLINDMGTSTAELKRGDVYKSVQCYMHDNGVTEEVALEYIRHLTDDVWQKMNAEVWIDSRLPQGFVDVVVNALRVSKRTYLYGDGLGVQDRETKSNILMTLVDTIPIP